MGAELGDLASRNEVQQHIAHVVQVLQYLQITHKFLGNVRCLNAVESWRVHQNGPTCKVAKAPRQERQARKNKRA